jgi:hypothetical protein
MILDINFRHANFIKDILPFIRNGIIIDTTVLEDFINGFINARFTKKESDDYIRLLLFLDYLKIKNNWNKFIITPHILAEVCNHFKNSYRKHEDYQEKVCEIIPMLREMKEESISKEKILEYIDLSHNKPIVEVGDISINLVAENIVSSSRKVAILANDSGFSRTFKYHPNVMVMDYKNAILNSI